MAIELDDPFSKLCETFDMDSTEAQAVEKIDDNKKRIVALGDSVSSKQKYDLQDKEYIRFELQSLIEENRVILQALGEQCKAGAAPRLFEVYATLSTAVRESLRELRDINKTITDYQVTEDREQLKQDALELKKKAATPTNAIATDGGTVNIQNNLSLTSQQMLDMLKDLNLPTKETKLEELPEFDLS